MKPETAMRPTVRTALCIVAGFALLTAASADATANAQKRRRGKSRTHVVKRGQTLSKIARVYGCKVATLVRANRKAQKIIRPGQRLAIPRACDRSPEEIPAAKGGAHHAPPLLYKVRKGDHLGKIARRFDVSIRHIKRRNRIRKYLRVGQILKIVPGTGGKGRPVHGQSVGWPHSGRLEKGHQLPAHKHYYRRRPHFAWGASHVIHHVKRMVKYVRSRYRRLHPLAIGDISRKVGGHLTTHKSHQTGRDIDIGWYFKRKKVPSHYPKSFAVGHEKNLHIPATFAMVRYLASTARSPGGVERIFINTSVQKILYEYGKKKGVSKRTLDMMFQYPNGGGLIRHDPGHDNHMHVRFKCPKTDKQCR